MKRREERWLELAARAEDQARPSADR